MDYKISDHVHLKISLAVQVIDDFTNQAISGPQVTVRIDGVPKPIRKTDGYYVFLNIRDSVVNLDITAPQFFGYKERVNLAELNPLEPVIRVRLRPNRCYCLPRGTTCVEGKAEPGSTVRILCPEITGYLRLMKDYQGKKDKDICIFNPNAMDMEGKCFCIMEKEKKMEDFTIGRLEDAAEERYSLKEPMSHSYKTVSARIYPVLLLKADEKGDFFAPVPFLEKEHTEADIRISGDSRGKKQKLVYGTVNKIFFERGED